MRLSCFLAALACPTLALAGGALAADRYGAVESPPQAALPAPGSPTGAAMPQRLLSWAGKTQPSALAEPTPQAAPARPAPAPPPQASWRRPAPTMAAPAAYSAPAYSAPAYPAPVAYAAPAPAPTTGAPPTSLYSAPSPAPAPAPTFAPSPAMTPAAATAPARNGPYSGGARFYSVHREYGERPDPIPAPLAQPFFNGPATDLAEPPPPVDPRTPQQIRAANAQADSGVANARPGSQGGDWGAGDDPGLAASGTIHDNQGGRP